MKSPLVEPLQDAAPVRENEVGARITIVYGMQIALLRCGDVVINYKP